MIRESGPANWANMTWYDGMETFAAGLAGMYPDCDFFAQTYEDPQKSKVAGKVGYALLPPGPAGTTYSGAFYLGAGHEQRYQEQRGGLALHPVGHLAAHAPERHGGVQKLQSHPGLGHERPPDPEGHGRLGQRRCT